VISDLKSKSDIQGAVLIKGGGQVIASALPREDMKHMELLDLLPKVPEMLYTQQKKQNVMFPHLVSEHNGRRVLTRSVMEDLFLLILLQKSCYMGPAMLDMENSILRIREILSSQRLQQYQK
jgi:hypothetical protein